MTPVKPELDRPLAMRLAATEYERCAELMAGITGPQWGMPTECPGWDVRQMSAHLLGMVEMAASLREQRRQSKVATAGGGFDLDALTDLQVRERADWTGERIAARYAERWPAAAKSRRRAPGFVRRRPIPPFDVNGAQESWTLGYLLDVILTRDPWMHRIDICRALGRAPMLTADHDGVLVADVVAEWVRRHGASFALTLTGPAGGSWTSGSGAAPLELDAVDFCRVVALRDGTVSLDELHGIAVPF